MPEFTITAPIPPRINNRRLQARILNILKATARKLQFELKGVTLTWEHKPDFEIDLHYAGGDAVVTVSTDDEIFGYLDEGTSIRWALMSSDFRPKTQVRTLASFPGSGHAVLRGASAFASRGMAARPGIEAREWTALIVEIYGTNFELDIADAVREELGEL